LIEIWTGESLARAPDVANDVFRLRHSVFCEDLKWVPISKDGLERDEYDRCALHPIYLVARDTTGVVSGSVRLLPTTDSYMLKDTFGYLWNNQPAIEDPSIWEASRFVTSRNPLRARSRRGEGLSAGLLLQGMCEFGLSFGVDQYLVVVTPSMNALVRGLGAITDVIGSSSDQSGQTILAVKCEVSLKVLKRLRNSTGISHATTDRQREGLEDVYAA